MGVGEWPDNFQISSRYRGHSVQNCRFNGHTFWWEAAKYRRYGIQKFKIATR